MERSMIPEHIVRIGFGPITESNSFHQSGRKVASALQEDGRFDCGFFTWEPFSLEEMMAFDVLVFIKNYPPLEILRDLKGEGKRIILDYHDMFFYPSVYEENKIKKIFKKIYYFCHERKIRKSLRLFDVCFVASPVLLDIAREAGIEPYFLQRQLFNDKNEEKFKNYIKPSDRVTIYWTGVGENQSQNEPILSVLEKLHTEIGCRIIYSTDTFGDLGFIEYRKWDRDTWEDELLEADIAFRWRDTSNLQRCKDANKVMAYMGAALPVVVCPTESEKIIIENGVTGFFASTVKEFEEVITNLVVSHELRKKIGMSAHSAVWSKYSLKSHVSEIGSVVLDLLQRK